MKKYIKPTFITAGLVPTAFAVGCGVKITDANLEAMFEYWDVTDATLSFAESDGCKQPIPDGVTEYCKYTSTESATGTVFTS
jgi:hypothetical protein